MLHFVYDGAVLQPGQKSPGIRLGKLPYVRGFQVGVRQAGEGVPTECRFPGLPGAQHGDDGTLLEPPLQIPGYLSLNHCSVGANWKWQFQLCPCGRNLLGDAEGRARDADQPPPREQSPPKTLGRSRGVQLGAATGLDLLKLTRSLEVFKRYHGLALA